MKKYILLIVFLFICFLPSPVLASENVDISKETEKIRKIQVILEKAANIINNMANKYVERENFRNIMEERIIDRIVPWGHDKVLGKRDVDTIVVHSIYDALGMNPYDVDGVMYELAIYDVSSHYLISREGLIYRLVKDNDLAWHAGKSQLFDGRTSVNRFSIGIELLHHENDSANDFQYNALIDLIKYLQLDYHIKHITGHTNISLTTKTDPWNFDWIKFNTLFNK